MRQISSSILRAAGVVLLAAAATTAPAVAGDDGNLMIRLQGTYLSTNDKTKSLVLDSTNVTGAYTAKTSDSFIPTATLSYFFTKNIAAELFCCFASTKVDVYTGAGAKVGNAAST